VLVPGKTVTGWPGAWLEGTWELLCSLAGSSRIGLGRRDPPTLVEGVGTPSFLSGWSFSSLGPSGVYLWFVTAGAQGRSIYIAWKLNAMRWRPRYLLGTQGSLRTERLWGLAMGKLIFSVLARKGKEQSCGSPWKCEELSLVCLRCIFI
jgi:hypothetical protein